MDTLLLGNGSPLSTQHKFLNLARGRLWQLVDKRHPLRHFEMRQVIAGKLRQFCFCCLSTGPQDHKGMRRLAPAFVWHADDRNFLNRRVP